MSNQIRLKRGSGSDPSASDLVTGEVAVRTDNGKLFTKKDDGSVAEISGGGIEDGDKGDITVSNSGATFTIDNDAVTNSKLENMATQRIMGRTASGSGNPQHLTAAEARGVLNVEDGATADQTASEILTLIKTVDGSGSGLDADTLDGISSGSFLRSDADDSFSGTITANSDATNPIIKIQGAGPNFIQFASDSSGTVDADSINLIYRTSPNTLAFERASDATILFSVDADDGQALFQANLDVGGGLDVTGNISVSGTVDGRDVATDGSKLDGIESGATADQSNSEIKTAYEANSNTNAFTDALLSKLNGIAASATNVTNNNQLTNGAGYITATLTNEQVQDIVGGMVSGNTESGITVTYQDGDGTLDFSVASQTDNNFTTTLKNKLDGIASGATNVTNTNQLTNGAGFITSADGGNAATLDGIDSSEFLRSNADDTASRRITFTNNATDNEDTIASSTGSQGGIEIYNSGVGNDAFMAFHSGSDFALYFGLDADTNSLAVGGWSMGNNKYKIWHAGNDGSGSGLDADTLDSLNSTSFLRSDTSDTASGDITFSGGAGAATIASNSDIRFSSGNWTGNATKIQHHASYLYIQGGSNGIIFRHSNGTDRWFIDSSGHLDPITDSAYDIGESGKRVRNGYFDTLYGDGSNLTGISAGATGGGSDEVFYENDQTVTTNYTITNGKNAMAAGPITINSGVTVTVGSGETLTIV